MNSATPRGVALGAATSLLCSLCGCVSAPTRRHLDRVYTAASLRLGESPDRSAAVGEAAVASEAASVVELRTPLDRDEVVARAVASSPALALMAERARALVHGGRVEASLPPAELAVEVWNLPFARPYAVGEADMYMVELRQRFAPAGSRDARARALAEEAEAVLAELSDEEQAVVQRAADAFAEYAQAHAERGVQERQIAQLGRMGQAIRARYTTGGAELADAARVDLELAKARRSLARVDGDLARARAGLNSLMRRPLAAPLGEPREAPPETVAMELDELLASANANRPATLAADARLRAAGARSEAARAQARAPEFMLGFGYYQDPGMRPGFGASAAMTLPWLWGPGRHEVARAGAEEAAERAARALAGRQAEVDIAEARARLDAFAREHRVLRSEALPAARRSLDAVAAAYATGEVGLLEWVDAARSVLDVELELAALHGELAHTVAALERAVGARLPRAPLEIGDVP